MLSPPDHITSLESQKPSSVSPRRHSKQEEPDPPTHRAHTFPETGTASTSSPDSHQLHRRETDPGSRKLTRLSCAALQAAMKTEIRLNPKKREENTKNL